MKQTIAETFFILIQNPEKSRSLVTGEVKNIGLIGSILLDLSMEEKIELESDKLQVKSTRSSLSESHNQILEQIAKSPKARKTKTWISRLSRHIGKYKKNILIGLETKGIISIEQKRFLFFTYYKTRLINKSLRSRLVDDLRDMVLFSKPVEKEDSAILGLIEACKMYKIICRNKDEIKLCRSKLKDMIRSDLVSQEVNQVIRDTQVAIHAAIVASNVATTAATS
jgi:hypothetical protein